MTTPLPASAQALFDRILPKGGADVAIIRETHTLASHRDFFTRHLSHLRTQQHLGGFADESAPYMNVIFWAYRDGILGDRELKQAISAYIDPKNHKLIRSSVQMITEATRQGIDYFAYDARHFLLSSKIELDATIDYVRTKHPEFQNWDGKTKLPATTRFAIDPADQKEGLEADASLLIRVTQILAGNPHYTARLEQIEKRAERLRDQGLPYDAIAAVLIAEHLPRDRNLVVFPGADHASGVHSRENKLEGIIDESLTALLASSGRTVRDGMLMDQPDLLESISSKRTEHGAGSRDHDTNPKHQQCTTRDHTEFVFNTSTGRLHLPPAPRHSGQSPTLTATYDRALREQKLAKGRKPDADALLDTLHAAGFDVFSCNHRRSISRRSPLLPTAEEAFAPALHTLSTMELTPQPPLAQEPNARIR